MQLLLSTHSNTSKFNLIRLPKPNGQPLQSAASYVLKAAPAHENSARQLCIASALAGLDGEAFGGRASTVSVDLAVHIDVEGSAIGPVMGTNQ